MRPLFLFLFSLPVVLAVACTPHPALPSASSEDVASHFRYTGHAPVVGQHGMVVTDAARATAVGRDVLARGGNAVDAAIATAFALAVVYPTAGNIGGGGFMVARVGGRAYALDFRETAPAAATHDTYLGHPSDAREGARSAGVPGSVAGLFAAYERLGSKRVAWADLVAPSIALAESGFEADLDFTSMIAGEADRLARYEGSRALFLPAGVPVPRGARWSDADLAGALRRIARDGPAGFYQGPTAEMIAHEVRDGGGFITVDDLRDYRAAWREPLTFAYRGRTVIGMPPPSSGGVTLGMICHIVARDDLERLGWHSPREIHLVVEAMRRAFAARNARLGDPDFVPNPTAELLSDTWSQIQRRTIADDRATPSRDIAAAPSAPEGPHTTHVSIVDGAGDAVALTTTINERFGSAVTVRGAGFVLNDEMDDFAAIPGTPNGYGLVQAEPNAVAPHKRMLSAMAPTIVVDRDGKVELVLGAAGGPTIITSVFQVVSNVVDFHEDVVTALGAPRIHMQHLPDVLTVESGGLPPSTMRALSAMGYAFRQREHIADVVAIGRAREENDVWVGASEPRRPGGAALGL